MSEERRGRIRRFRAREGQSKQYYGRLLLLIVLTFAVGIAFGDRTWGSFIYLCLQTVTLLLALNTSEATRRAKRITVGLLVPVVAGAAVAAFFGDHAFHEGLVGAVGAVLVLIALLAIGREVTKHPEVSTRTVMGALCIYLLIGLFYAYFEQFLGAVGDGGFFAGQGDGTTSDYIYFSYVTLTTTGYGDLVAGGTVGRSVAVTEAIIGQLYLVTVVGITVGTFAGSLRDQRSDDPDTPNPDQS